MFEIAHFAAGVIGGLLILMYYPQIIPNALRNDIFFIFASGLWGMLPDLNKLVKNNLLDKLHANPLANIFWGHNYLDTFPDTAKAASVIIAIAIVVLYFYFTKLK